LYDRGFLFLFSIVMIAGSLAAAGYLIVSGQAATVDGLFLLLTALLVAVVFALYVKYMIGRAMEQSAPKPQAAKAPAKETAAKTTAPVES
jgi:membrane protein DedA with SNARE-associated domain